MVQRSDDLTRARQHDLTLDVIPLRERSNARRDARQLIGPIQERLRGWTATAGRQQRSELSLELSLQRLQATELLVEWGRIIELWRISDPDQSFIDDCVQGTI